MTQDIDSLQIEERAGLWLVRRDSADWSQNDEAEFQAWLEQSTAHVVAFVRLEAAWQQARRLKALGAMPPEGWQPNAFSNESAPVGEVSFPSSIVDGNRAGRTLYAIAANILLTIAALIAWYAWPAGPEYRTPVGGLASLPMKDGSNVTLNTDSQIRVALTEAERRVNLQQGEAFFEVAKDPNRPFVVAVDNMRIIAVGTAFSVRRDGNGVRVAVTEGRVRIEDMTGQPIAKENPGEGVLMLSAGDIARATDAGVLVQQKPIQEIDGDLSWRTGYLLFRDMALADAVEEFNRYNDRKILIEDQAVATIRLSGKFRSTQFEAFVRLLEEGFPVRAQHVNGQIILTDGRRPMNTAAAPQN